MLAVEQQWNRGALRSSRLSAVFALLAAFWAVQDCFWRTGGSMNFMVFPRAMAMAIDII